MVKGKCTRCRIVFSWSGKPLLRDAACPACNTKLERTTTELRHFAHSNDRPKFMEPGGANGGGEGDGRAASVEP